MTRTAQLLCFSTVGVNNTMSVRTGVKSVRYCCTYAIAGTVATSCNSAKVIRCHDVAMGFNDHIYGLFLVILCPLLNAF